LTLTMFEESADRSQAIASSPKGLTCWRKILDKERFFAFARRTYWESPGQVAAPGADADAHRQARLLMDPETAVAAAGCVLASPRPP